MTRGPQPLIAIRGAQEIACRRGVVLDTTVIQRSHYDFVLFIAGCTVFVRIKRIRTHISNPQEIARMFTEEIQQLRTVPNTPVVSREIWVVSPWKSWQYFQISDDRIVEVRCNGQPVLHEVKVPG
ncbi:MAG: hypothetical protein M0Q91_11245 [Methanoregula sp.]|jgi:hypothetical protein|nr:hypothetical protein [Methanoregula sp.]